MRAARASSISAIEDLKPGASVVPGPGSAVVAKDVAVGTGDSDDTCGGVGVAELGGGSAVREFAVVAAPGVAALGDEFTTDEFTTDEFATDESASDPPVEHATRDAAAPSISSRNRPNLVPHMPPRWHNQTSIASVYGGLKCDQGCHGHPLGGGVELT